MQCSCLRRDLLGWLLFMVSFIFQLNALLEQTDVSTAILQSSSEYTQQCFVHAVYALMKTAE